MHAFIHPARSLVYSSSKNGSGSSWHSAHATSSAATVNSNVMKEFRWHIAKLPNTPIATAATGRGPRPGRTGTEMARLRKRRLPLWHWCMHTPPRGPSHPGSSTRCAPRSLVQCNQIMMMAYNYIHTAASVVETHPKLGQAPADVLLVTRACRQGAPNLRVVVAVGLNAEPAQKRRCSRPEIQTRHYTLPL